MNNDQTLMDILREDNPAQARATDMLNDVTGSGISNCCSASVYRLGDDCICQDCKEHCDEVNEE